MLTCALLVVLSLSPPRGDATAPPDPARVEAAVTELAHAFERGASGDRVRALDGQGTVPDARVVDWVARGLRDRELVVRKGAIEALRRNAHASSVAKLHAHAGEKGLRAEPALHALVLRAIGQHGDPRSVAVLAEDAWSVQDRAVLEARLLGLGRIREPAAVEALFGLMKAAGKQRIQPLMGDFRLALLVLTGVDQGSSQELWLAWWNENKSRLRVAARPGELPPPLRARWDRYWGEGTDAARTARGRERGGDGGAVEAP